MGVNSPHCFAMKKSLCFFSVIAHLDINLKSEKRVTVAASKPKPLNLGNASTAECKEGGDRPLGNSTGVLLGRLLSKSANLMSEINSLEE